MDEEEKEMAFYQKIVLFYYKYLLSKYFSQLKHSKGILARYAQIGHSLKSLRQSQIAASVFIALKQHRAENRQIRESGDKLAFRLLIAPRLRSMRQQMAESSSNHEKSRKLQLSHVFRRFASSCRYQLAMRRKEILAGRHRRARVLKMAYYVISHVKQINIVESAMRQCRLTEYDRKRDRKSLRKAIVGFSMNAWAKFIPYREEIRKSKKLLVMKVLFWNCEVSRRLQVFTEMSMKRKKAAILDSFHKNVLKNRKYTENFDAIREKDIHGIKSAIFNYMKNKAQKSIILATRLDQWNRVKYKTIRKQALYDWILARRERVIEKKITPRLILKSLFAVFRQKIDRNRAEEDQDRIVRMFRFKWGQKFMLFLLKLNNEIQAWKKVNRDKAENKWKCVIFDTFTSKVRDLIRLRMKADIISQKDLLLKFRAWRDLTLGALTNTHYEGNLKAKVFLEWREAIHSNQRIADYFHAQKLEHTKAACLHTLHRYKQACHDSRYRLLQAITFERCSSKRRLLAILSRAVVIAKQLDVLNVDDIEKRAKCRVFDAWRCAFDEARAAVDAKYAANRRMLRDCLKSWSLCAVEERIKADREREAGRDFWRERKRELMATLIAKVVDKKAHETQQIMENEAYQRKKGLQLAKIIGRSWLERTRKRLKERNFVRISTNTNRKHDFNKPASYKFSTFNLSEYQQTTVKPVSPTQDEEKMAAYLDNFRLKKRLSPTLNPTKPVQQDQPVDRQPADTYTHTPVTELEHLLHDYRLKTQLLNDDLLPLSIRKSIETEQKSLKDRIKLLYAAVRKT